MNAVCEDCKPLGIAKRDMKKGELLSFPIDIITGELLPNKNINFIYGKNVRDLMKGGNDHGRKSN